ncbi:MAG: alpha/beta hydrolase [Saprospiraceae bacterium]|nr:alpha/beta hydrolase [Saprospiraceae bacterium]
MHKSNLVSTAVCIFALLMTTLVFGQSVTEHNNLSYTSDLTDTLRQINLIVAEDVSQAPLLIWIGGGAWSYVNRHMEMELCRKIAAEGITVASVGHRLSPQLLREPHRVEGVRHPAHIEDLAQAFAWLHAHAEEYGYDTASIFVGGFSSGAHLSTLLISDYKYLEGVGHSVADVAGIIPIGGAFDIIHYRDILTAAVPAYLENHIHAVFGESDASQMDASPSQFIAHIKTPMLVISDTNTYKYNKHFEEQLKEAEFALADVLHVGSLSHGELWKDIGAENSRYRSVIVNYIRSLQNTP